MNRREFSKRVLVGGAGLRAGSLLGRENGPEAPRGDYYEEPARRLPVADFDVVVAGGGTAGVVAALAAARQGVRTALIEIKGYTGGTVVEGGTALHSFYNLWKAFPGVTKRQVVRGIPQEIVDRLTKAGGCSGHAEMDKGFGYDSVCTAIDTELYKLVTMEMLFEAGVRVALNTRLVGAITEGSRVKAAIAKSPSGRQALRAGTFVDCTAYGDLAAFAGAGYAEPDDYDCCNSVGIGNVDIDQVRDFMAKNGEIGQVALGTRSGEDGKVVRVGGSLGPEFSAEAERIGMSAVTTTVHDHYLMFIKCDYRVPGKVTDRDAMARAELEVRKRMAKAVALFKKYVPGCEKAFMARTSPSLSIRRGRQIICDYDITRSDVLDGRHFEDDVMSYGFHDSAPRLQIKNGGAYGIPYRALRVAGVENLLAAGMLITSDPEAHMSTRNTVSCMGQGQAAGTAAALSAAKKCGTRDLNYVGLRDALRNAGVYLES